MKYMHKIVSFLQVFFLLGFSSNIIHAEVVITEFFIHTAENSNVPQYIELFNNSDTTVNLESWWIETLYVSGESTLDIPSCNIFTHACFPTFTLSSTASLPSFCDVYTTTIGSHKLAFPQRMLTTIAECNGLMESVVSRRSPATN